MAVNAHFIVTNISPYNVRLEATELKIGKVWPQRFIGHVTAQPHGGGPFGKHMIPSGCMTEILTTWLIEPPVWKSSMSMTANVAVYDNFGNRHWLKRVRFEYRS